MFLVLLLYWFAKVLFQSKKQLWAGPSCPILSRSPCFWASRSGRPGAAARALGFAKTIYREEPWDVGEILNSPCRQFGDHSWLLSFPGWCIQRMPTACWVWWCFCGGGFLKACAGLLVSRSSLASWVSALGPYRSKPPGFWFLSYQLPPLNQCVELPPLPSSLPIPTVIPATALFQQFPDREAIPGSICWLTLTLKVNTNAVLIFVMLFHLGRERGKKFLRRHCLSLLLPSPMATNCIAALLGWECCRLSSGPAPPRLRAA